MAAFLSRFLVRKTESAPMKNQNDAQQAWRQQQTDYFDTAAAFYELSLFEEAQAELNKIDPSAADSILVIAFRLGIAHSRRDWNERKPLPEGSHESNSVAQLESFSCHSHHRFGWPKSHLEDMRKKA
jgi:hypothetical protein